MRAKLRLSFCVSAFCILHSAFLYAQAPAWWYARGVIDPSLSAHDYSPVTLGQLKWIAAKAADEMNAYFGAGANVMAVVNAFVDSDNYIVATVGQVKYVAQPFYDRLNQLELIHTLPPGMPGRYPWGNAPVNDYALATIGQVKYVFSFDSAKDSDGDELSDWQEEALKHGATISGNVIYSGPQVGPIYVDLAENAGGTRIAQRQTLSQPGAFAFNEVPALRTYWLKAWRDSNGNSYRDFWEAQGDSAANPIYLTANVANANVTLSDPDTDNDTLPDWWEIMWFGYGNLTQGPNGDPDRDLISNQQEFHFGWDPTMPTITIANATFLAVEPNTPRPADTTLFFRNQDFAACGKTCGSDDTEYGSSWDIFTHRDDHCPQQGTLNYRNRYEDYLVNKIQSDGGYGGMKSVFFLVDVLYEDYGDYEDNSGGSKLERGPGFESHINSLGFNEIFTNWLNANNIIPIVTLMTDAPRYGYESMSDDTIYQHAYYFGTKMREAGLPAFLVLGIETPESGRFSTEKANGIIGRISQDISDYNLSSVAAIGVHMQGDWDDGNYTGPKYPSYSQFLAYEFSWYPWCGRDKSYATDGEMACEARNVMAVGKALNVGVHFHEYNVRVEGCPAKKQAELLDGLFQDWSSDDGICHGISRSPEITCP